MQESTASFSQVLMDSKHLSRQLLTIGENRLELLTVEVQEERQRLLHAILLAFSVASFALLGGVTLTAAIVVLFWAYSPLAVLASLTCLYAASAVLLCRQLGKLLHGWEPLSASLSQLRKDCTCLAKILT